MYQTSEFSSLEICAQKNSTENEVSTSCDAVHSTFPNPTSTVPVFSSSSDSEVRHVPAGLSFVLNDPKRGGGQLESTKRDGNSSTSGSSADGSRTTTRKDLNVWTCPKKRCGFANNFQSNSKCYKCHTLRPESRLMLNQATARSAIALRQREALTSIRVQFLNGMHSIIATARLGPQPPSPDRAQPRKQKSDGYTTVGGTPRDPVRKVESCRTAECAKAGAVPCSSCRAPYCPSCLHSASPPICRGCREQAWADKKQREQDLADRRDIAAAERDAAAKRKADLEKRAAFGTTGGGGGRGKVNRHRSSGSSSSSGRDHKRRRTEQNGGKSPSPPLTSKGLRSLLKDKSHQERYNILHNRLYNYILHTEMDTTVSGKIAGMIMELQEEKVVDMLYATELLDVQIEECKKRLPGPEDNLGKCSGPPQRGVGKKNRRSERSSSDAGDAERNTHARYLCGTCKKRVFNPNLRCKKCDQPCHDQCHTAGYCDDCLVAVHPNAHEPCKVCNKPIGAKDHADCPVCRGLIHQSCMRGGKKNPHCKDCPAPVPVAKAKVPKASNGNEKPTSVKVKPVPVAGPDPPPEKRDDIVVAKLNCGLCLDQDQATVNPVTLTRSCKCGAKICDKHALPPGTETFDSCRVCETKDDHPSARDNPLADPSTWKPGTAMELGVIRTFFGIMEKVVTRFPVKHVEEWELRKPDLCKKVMSLPGRKDCVLWLKDPDHWVYLLWDGDDIKHARFMESLQMPHDKLAPTLQGIGVTDGTPLSGVKMARFKERDDIELSCGPCAINNGFAIRAYGGLSDDPLLTLGALRSEEAFLAEIRKHLDDQQAEHTENDMENHKGVHRRPMHERIKKIADLPAPPPAGFPESTEGLHRAQVNPEAIPALTSDQRVADLLSLTHLVLPKQSSIRSGVSEKQRRKHLYVLLDVINLLCKETKPILSLEEAMVRGVDLLEEERAWSAKTTKVNYANCLYGAILRINQYTGLMWTANLALDQTWKDAMTTWTKSALCHVPKWTEVSIEAVHRMIAKASSVVKVWIMLSWASTGRPGNLYSLQWTDLVFSPTKEGYKVAIQWRRHHKTMEKVGAYTNHSWIPHEWYETIMQFKSTATSEWLLPLKEQRTYWAELTRLVKEECPDWDLRSFRRGALSTMARNGVPLEMLLQFSGHKNIPMLLRYLQFGLHAGDRAEKAAVAAQTAHTGKRYTA
jgi:hypothetical protein